jgi:aryl-alcohol dehydrogenase-like predicted oxidoreductase
LRYRSLGGSGVEVSEIGFGAWGIGGDAAGAVAYGPADRNESLKALRRAADVGVNFFDTADFYGFGRSEELIGEALSSRRASIVIASKVGMLDASGSQDFSAQHIRTSLAASLKRLATDYIDVYQLHSPPAELLAGSGGPLEELQALKKSGHIRAVGVSLRAPQDGLAIAEQRKVDCVQVNFNILDQRAIDCGLFDACAANGVGVICRTPLCFGFLTGKYRADADYAASDHRSRWSVHQRQRWALGAELFAKWRHGTPETPAQFALRYCLSFDAVTCAIPGMLTADHVDENAASSDLGPLPAAALTEIRQHYRGQEFFIATGG